MGVTQLWQIVSPVQQHHPLSSLSGQILAVDLSIWVCENQSVKQMQGVVSKPFLRNLFFRILHLTQLGVRLVFVVEGRAPELKWEAMMKRQQARYPAKSSGGIRPLGKQTRRNFNTCLKECCQLLDILGIPYVQSIGEAESMCAALNAAGLVDGCLTNDGDAFLYGAQVVYRNFTMNTKDPHVEGYSMSDIETELGIDRNGMVSLALILGCDYLPKGVPGVGVANAVKLLKTLQGRDVLHRLKQWRDMRDTDCLDQVELVVRRKALTLQDFPQTKVIQEFTVMRDHCPQKIQNWNRPNMRCFQEFSLTKLEWPVEYSLEKILPLVTLWDMRDSLTTETALSKKHLKPHRIVKERVRQGVPSFEVEWHKPDTDQWSPGDYYVTIETQEIFGQCFPDLVQQHQTRQESKKSSKRGKKKREKVKKYPAVVMTDTSQEFLNSRDDMSQDQLPVRHDVAILSVDLSQLNIKSSGGTETDAGSSVSNSCQASVASYFSHVKQPLESNENLDKTNIIQRNAKPNAQPNSCHENLASNHHDISCEVEEEDYFPLSERIKLKMQVNKKKFRLDRLCSVSDQEEKDIKHRTHNNGRVNSLTVFEKSPLTDSQQLCSGAEDMIKMMVIDFTNREEEFHFTKRTSFHTKTKDSLTSAGLPSMQVCIKDEPPTITNNEQDYIILGETEDRKYKHQTVKSLLSPSSSPSSVRTPVSLKSRLTNQATSSCCSESSPKQLLALTDGMFPLNQRMSSPSASDFCSPVTYLATRNFSTDTGNVTEQCKNTGESPIPHITVNPDHQQSFFCDSVVKETANTALLKSEISMHQTSMLDGSDVCKSHHHCVSSVLGDSHCVNITQFGDFQLQTSLLNSLCASLNKTGSPVVGLRVRRKYRDGTLQQFLDYSRTIAVTADGSPHLQKVTHIDTEAVSPAICGSPHLKAAVCSSKDSNTQPRNFHLKVNLRPDIPKLDFSKCAFTTTVESPENKNPSLPSEQKLNKQTTGRAVIMKNSNTGSLIPESETFSISEANKKDQSEPKPPSIQNSGLENTSDIVDTHLTLNRLKRDKKVENKLLSEGDAMTVRGKKIFSRKKRLGTGIRKASADMDLSSDDSMDSGQQRNFLQLDNHSSAERMKMSAVDSHETESSNIENQNILVNVTRISENMQLLNNKENVTSEKYTTRQQLTEDGTVTACPGVSHRTGDDGIMYDKSKLCCKQTVTTDKDSLLGVVAQAVASVQNMLDSELESSPVSLADRLKSRLKNASTRQVLSNITDYRNKIGEF